MSHVLEPLIVNYLISKQGDSMSTAPLRNDNVESMVASLVSELMADLQADKLVLPSLPEVALKVRDIIDDPDADAASIAKVISTDAGMTARLLQVANSPLVRGNRKIDGVEIAITRMGSSMTKNIVTSLIVQQMFQPTTELTDKKMREFWEHSTRVAAISHALAGMVKLKPDLALLAGLVHDIGALPVIKRAEEMPELLKDESVLDEVIRQLHVSIGEAMLKKWDFAAEIVVVAACHEDYNRAATGKVDYVDIVTVANLQSYFASQHRLGSVDWSTVSSFERLGLSTEISIVDMDDTGESIKEIETALRGG